MQSALIGIFTGTFDPIHLGHMHLAKQLLKLYKLQKILFIPCHQSPLRNQPIASPADRFNMVKLAIADANHLFVDDREINQKNISYTITTVRSLRQEYPKTPLTLILGIDVFNRFDEWHEWQKFLDLVHLLIVNRLDLSQITNTTMQKLLQQHQTTDVQQLQKKPAGLIYLADIQPLPINATVIRTLIKEQKDASHLVATKVWQYICEKHLYRS